MGWLFAVALGLHRGSRAAVLHALVPIGLGHALSIAIVAAAVILLGSVIDGALLNRVAGAVLLLWAIYHVLGGRRHRVRIGMRAGFAGLLLWSFLVASAHGAGLMLVPALIPLCLSEPAGALSSGSLPRALGAVGVHTAATLLVTCAVALAVYEWIGLAFLRRGWIDLDRLWVFALAGAGIWLLAN